jgi:2,3-bisphosphoglycerate-independent phosphoglycerate mutase
MNDPGTGPVVCAVCGWPVPLVLVGPPGLRLRDGGALQDVAPTVLALLGLPQPIEMTGRSLVEPD